MPRFRVTVRRTETSHEVVQIEGSNALEAARRAQRYIEGERRGVNIVQPFDDDSRATDELEVIAIKEA
jgi:uncharacterized NAD-dependent epimerase/dehydratase family protein